MKKPLFALALALSVFAFTGAGAALAHECFNANRSAKGNEGADHSPMWLTLDLEVLAEDIQLTEAQTEEFLDAAEEAGVPFSFTIFIGNKTIGENAAGFLDGGREADGKGIDWFFEAYGPTLFGIICGDVDPDNPICTEGPPED